MSQQRVNEPATPKPVKTNINRSPRSFEADGRWYFELRGGGQKGPYDSEQEMLAALNEFIHFHEEMNQQI